MKAVAISEFNADTRPQPRDRAHAPGTARSSLTSSSPRSTAWTP